jgi:hypothetical protein
MTTIDCDPPMADAHRRIWWVTKYDRIFARLQDARFSDMFWVRYTVVDLTSTSDDQLLLFSKDFWLNAPLPTFEHVETGVVVDTAFAGSGVIPSLEQSFVIIRALHPPVEQVTVGQRLKRWLLRFRK